MPRDICTDLESERDYACRAIDEAAETARGRHMTTRRGQEAEYAEKQRVAAGVLSTTVATIGSSPMLAAIRAEATARGIALTEMCRVIRDRKASTDDAIARIANIRSPAKAKLRRATTVAAIARIRHAAISQLNTA